MSKEHDSLMKQVKNLKIAVIIMAFVIALMLMALIVVYRVSTLQGDRIYDRLNNDIERLEFELKLLK